MAKSESRMQFCEDFEKVIKEYTRPYRDPKSHKNHKRVMEQLKRISKCWRRLLRHVRRSRLTYVRRSGDVLLRDHVNPLTNTQCLPPPFVKQVQHCFLPSL